MPLSSEDEHDIQGVGLARFRKDHQELLFLRFNGAARAQRLLATLGGRVASLWEVRRFNELFHELTNVRDGPERVIQATWIALGISAHGYRTLGVDLEELGTGEGATAFREGMANRSLAGHLGDSPGDQPEKWLPAFQPTEEVDAIIVVASDDADTLDRTLVEVIEVIETGGVEVVLQERGATLPPPLTGHEHFGFKDGISQPAIQELEETPATGEPGALPIGEFVLGHPNLAGENPVTGELWRNGSYGIFRRLHQDVAAFRTQAVDIASVAPAAGEATNPAQSSEQVAAKLIGRWAAGAPLDQSPETQPATTNKPNAFDYGSDPDGERTPRFAHVRKVNPRNEEREDREQNPAQEHRIIRAGIPYGPPSLRTRRTTASSADCTSSASSPTWTDSSSSCNANGPATATSPAAGNRNRTDPTNRRRASHPTAATR